MPKGWCKLSSLRGKGYYRVIGGKGEGNRNKQGSRGQIVLGGRPCSVEGLQWYLWDGIRCAYMPYFATLPCSGLSIGTFYSSIRAFTALYLTLCGILLFLAFMRPRYFFSLSGNLLCCVHMGLHVSAMQRKNLKELLSISLNTFQFIGINFYGENRILARGYIDGRRGFAVGASKRAQTEGRASLKFSFFCTEE